MHITILLFNGITALDAIGPYEVLAHVPGYQVHFAGLSRGAVASDTGSLRFAVDKATSEITETDVLIIPGGPGSRAMAATPAILQWVQDIHRHTRFTTSVCTGSRVLAAAGLLKGLPATGHWAHRDRLADHGALPTDARVVRAGRIITAAGVSAGIDMAFSLLAELAGEPVARAVQLALEYAPEPPFDSGSPETAAPALVEAIRAIELGQATQVVPPPRP